MAHKDDDKLSFDDLCERLGIEDGLGKDLAMQYFSMEQHHDKPDKLADIIGNAMRGETIMKNFTYWDEELGSYILTEEGKKLSERDMINIIGILEHETKIKNKEVFAIIEWATGLQ